MKKKMVKVAAVMLFFVGLSIGSVRSNSTGAPAGATGAPAGGGFPAELTCQQSGCHATAPLNPDNRGRVELTGVPDNYVPGQRYTLRFALTQPDPDRRRWGFQATALTADTFLPAGEFVVTDRRNTQTIRGGPGGNREYIEQTILGSGLGRVGGFSWTFDWVAPGENVGDVAFYGAGNAANADGSDLGDKIYTRSPNPLALIKGQFSFTNIAVAANLVTEAGGGVAIGDFNNDGARDIFVAAGDQYLLFRNGGDGTFAEVAESAGIVAGDAQGQAAAWGDFDGDGYLDLYVVNTGSDVLLRNNTNGTFTDVSAEAGISDQAVGHSAAWGDFDGDEMLDLYVANDGQDILYLNNGDGTFTKTDPAATGTAEQAAGRSVALADFNGDGRLDIFVANDGQDFLLQNNGDGSFTDVANAAGIQTADTDSRAAAWADYDLDGDQDLFITNVGADRLFKNNGDSTFTDVTAMAGLVDEAVGLSAAWGDYDNDGDPDLFVANEGQDFLYRNNGNGTFNEVAMFSGMTDMASGRGTAWIDVNNDGHLDLFVSNAVGDNFLYRNPGRSGPVPTNLISEAIAQNRGAWISFVAWLAAFPDTRLHR